MSEIQGTLFGASPSPIQIAASAPRPCDDGGPFFDYYYTPSGAKQYRRLHCTRPPHFDDIHQHATRLGGVLCSWARNGQPIHPNETGGIIPNGH